MEAQPLWKHQQNGIVKGLECNDYGLFYEAGTGKTRTTIEILRRRFHENGRLMRTFIFAPLIVCDNWRREFQMFSKIKPHDILVLTRSGKQRQNDFINGVGEELNRAKIVITNYQATLMEDFFELIKKWGPEILICDESHKCKNHKGKMAKNVALLADKSRHNYILTGTPILNSPADIFQQFRILDRGETFGKNYYAFLHEYFYDKNASRSNLPGHFPKWELKPAAKDSLHGRLARKAMRVVKSECLDLPPLIRQEYFVELSTQQKRMYKEMVNEYIAFVKDLTDEHRPPAVTAQIAATKALRLQQIVSGFAKTEDGKVTRLDDVPRVAALKELLEDITQGSKVIVWCAFKENYKMVAEVCKQLKLDYREIHGAIDNQERITSMDAFRSDENVKVMIANQIAAGIGINLVEASYAIYFSKNFSLEADLQSEARNYRGGSHIHEKVTRIDLIAKDTIDVLVSEALKNKQEISERILSWSEQL